MASAQCEKPAHQTGKQIQITGHEKAVDKGCHRHQDHSEHRFSTKVKEVVETALMKITEHMHHNAPNHTQHGVVHSHTESHSQFSHANATHKPAGCPNSGVTGSDKKKGGGLAVSCFPKGEHKKKEKHMKKKKSDKKEKCKDSRSESSSSSSDSENEGHGKERN